VLPSEWLMNAEHIFSHIRWDLAVYRCRLSASSLPGFAGGAAYSAAGAPPSPGGTGASPASAAESRVIYSGAASSIFNLPEAARGTQPAADLAVNLPLSAEACAAYDSSASGNSAEPDSPGGTQPAADLAGDRQLPAAPASNPLRDHASLEGLPPHYRWMDFNDMENYAFPNVFLRILKAYRENRLGE
jgi:A/G-specific adenine glycosylase